MLKMTLTVVSGAGVGTVGQLATLWSIHPRYKRAATNKSMMVSKSTFELT